MFCGYSEKGARTVEHPKEDLYSGLFICGVKWINVWRKDAVNLKKAVSYVHNYEGIIYYIDFRKYSFVHFFLN